MLSFPRSAILQGITTMNYFFKLFSTGAIRKTPKKVLDVIIAEINVSPGINIIEAGAGYGEITSGVIYKTGPQQTLNYYAFEIDEHACHRLVETFSNVHVHNTSALNFADTISTSIKADYFISSIPLSFYRHGVLKKFFDAVKGRMKQKGKIIIVFSAPWLIPFLRKQLPGLKVEVFFTFPLYFVGIYKH
jgi:phospholipid N-methyltransferase